MRRALDQARGALMAGEFPVGCVMVYEDRVLLSGARQGSSGEMANEIEHAEMVALTKLSRLKSRIDTRRISLYTTMEPCLMCYAALILSGIRRIVYAYEDVMGGGTGCNMASLPPLYRNAKISVTPHVLRPESLALFKAFFASSGTSYWQGSLLARYTLSQ
jgi:tRNA(adenine34) deaminase